MVAGVVPSPQDSPPLARGLHIGRGAHQEARGLTPAGAGTSARGPSRPATPRTHPRWRGDFTWIDVLTTTGEDSPPLARGLLLHAQQHRQTQGLTPAGAGTSLGWSPHPAPTWTHPRWRGDFSTSEPEPEPPVDSPPLARGLQQPGLLLRLLGGLTPAGAGTSLPDQRILARPCLDSSLKTQVRVLQGVFLCPHHGTSTSATAPSRWVTVTNCRPSKSLTSYGWSPTRRISNP